MIINPDIVCREEFDGSGCLFNPNDGKVFGLNQISLFIWRQLEANHSVDEIVAALNKQCEGGAPAEAANDVKEFMAKLQELGFLSLE